jgi:hypothetical protein
MSGFGLHNTPEQRQDRISFQNLAAGDNYSRQLFVKFIYNLQSPNHSYQIKQEVRVEM